MNWIAILLAILGAVPAIALSVTAVSNSLKATLDLQTAKITKDTAEINKSKVGLEWDKARVELYMMLKKATQESAASSGTSEKPAYKEHGPQPTPSKVPKWFMFPFIASMLMYLGLIYYLTYTAPLTTYTIGSMFTCTFWVIINLAILIHRLINNRIQNESAWMVWVTLEMGHMQIYLTGACFRDVLDVARRQTEVMEQGILGLHNVTKLQLHAMEQAFAELKTLIGDMGNHSQ
jgi:hypothetical protein